MMLALVALLATTAPALPPPAEPSVSADGATPHAATTAADATVASRARMLFDRIAANDVDRQLLTPQFSSELSPAILATLARTIAGLGKPAGFVQRGKHASDGVTTYDFAVTFAAGALTITIGIDDASDLIARYYLRRTTTSPNSSGYDSRG